VDKSTKAADFLFFLHEYTYNHKQHMIVTSENNTSFLLQLQARPVVTYNIGQTIPKIQPGGLSGTSIADLTSEPH
jgi:hypothetical protein